MAGRGFEAYVAPVHPRAQVWRTVVGFVLIFLLYALLTAAVVVAGWWLSPVADRPFLFFAQSLDPPDTPYKTITLLFTFTGMILGVWLAARLLQRRGLRSVFGPGPRVLRDFVAAALAYGAVLAVFLLGWALVYDAEPNLPAVDWLRLLPVTILLLLYQTGAEELVFRGWLLQSLGARFASPVAWAVIPSLLFGAAHFNPSAFGSVTWVAMGATAVFGLFAADLTARTGSLGAAWGFHFVNNLVALALVAQKGSITGLALYVTPYAMDQGDVSLVTVLLDLGVIVLGWIVVRRVVLR